MMMMNRRACIRPILFFACSLLVVSCTDQVNEQDLCQRHFEPYPDLISGRTRTEKNATYLDAMALYAQGDLVGAEPLLRQYLQRRDAHDGAHLYLASCLLAMGKPYDAELELDHLERSNLSNFKDQVEWYTTLCLLCSGQTERALEAAKGVAQQGRHTYRQEATKLVQELQ